jgi:TPR repeat protein
MILFAPSRCYGSRLLPRDLAEAQYKLGACYDTGTGVVRDPARAFFQLDAIQGSLDATVGLKI